MMTHQLKKTTWKHPVYGYWTETISISPDNPMLSTNFEGLSVYAVADKKDLAVSDATKKMEDLIASITEAWG